MDESKNFLKFPDDFYWGAATAAHQIEGFLNNDWTEWEKENAAGLAELAEQRYSDLDSWNHIKEAAISSQNYISGKAANGYKLYNQDLEIIKKLNLNAYRFSIEWARIEPEEGKFDLEAINYYRNIILDLKKSHIEPFVTLWHFTLPVWLSKDKGWLNNKSIKYFTRYVETIIKAIPDVKFWITLNEPEIYTYLSYQIGMWPPQEKSKWLAYKLLSVLYKAHSEAYKTIKKINSNTQIGIVQNRAYYEPVNKRFINKLLSKTINFFPFDYYLNKYIDEIDFIGLNHYYYFPVNVFKEKRKIYSKSDLGWELNEAAIYNVLLDLKKHNKPIFITENGLADAKDAFREKFIMNTIINIHKAIAAGIDIKGYIHWSLLDNFEWDKGFWPRFGLVEIDYNTLERKIRKSAYKYAEIVKNNGIYL